MGAAISEMKVKMELYLFNKSLRWKLQKEIKRTTNLLIKATDKKWNFPGSHGIRLQHVQIKVNERETEITIRSDNTNCAGRYTQAKWTFYTTRYNDQMYKIALTSDCK